MHPNDFGQGSYGPVGNGGGSGLNTTPNRGFPGAGGGQGGPYRSVAHVHGHGYNRFTDPRGYGGQQGMGQPGMMGQPPMGQQGMGPNMGGNPRSAPYQQGPPQQQVHPAQRRPSTGLFGKMAAIGTELFNGLTGADARRRRPRSPPVQHQQGPPQGGHGMQGGMQGLGPRGMGGMPPQGPMGAAPFFMGPYKALKRSLLFN